MESFYKIKKEFENNIISNSIEGLNLYIQKQERFIKEDTGAKLLNWMLFGDEPIPEFKKKLTIMLDCYKKIHKNQTDKKLAVACFQLREKLVPLLIEHGLNVNYENNLGFNDCIFGTLFPYYRLKVTEEEKQMKRKTIFSLLIQNNISVNVLQKGTNNSSLYELLYGKNILHHLDWIDSFYGEFNQKQRKEWGVIRLQRLF